jgi:hypothetical protein
MIFPKNRKSLDPSGKTGAGCHHRRMGWNPAPPLLRIDILELQRDAVD